MLKNPLSHLVRGILLLVITLGSLIALPSVAGAVDIVCAPATPSVAPAETPQGTPVPEQIPFPEEGGSMTVFAAASLVDGFTVIETNLESANPGLDIVVETAGSQTLVTQLTEGAEADVLATASTGSMANAIDAGVISGDAANFIGNRLVIITPFDNPADVTSFEDLANDDLLLVLAGAEVPAGQYARNAICTGDDDFIATVGNNIVSEEENVRNVLAKVQIGEADAGIVYASDAVTATLAGAEINVIEFPHSINTTAVYPIAPVTGGNAALADAFISYILTADGQQTLLDYGFTSAG
ncbi:MAG: molybdate ABC transporter substrate-binding protein [Thermomicrobiales bacterium]